ncbi:DUF3152 domain-containing protein [Streptomyces sp. NPDC005931]|uniref:DUF3152 domain-containing protein n=1 Tax=Streptomyces sp. NPDC005931 TaxID=3364737 RepID=UPI00368ACAE9
MGRHSRRGPAPKGDGADAAAVRDGRGGEREAREARGDGAPGPGAAPAAGQTGRQATVPGPRPAGGPGPYGIPQGTPAYRHPAYDRPGYGTPPHGTPPHGTPTAGGPTVGVPRLPEGWLPDGTPSRGVPRMPEGTPPRGVPRAFDGTPARGVPRLPEGTPAHGVPGMPEGTPSHGVPRLSEGTPAHGVPRPPHGTPARGAPQARGGHPEQREPGGGWGTLTGRTVAGAGYGMPVVAPLPRQRQAPPAGPRQAPSGGPRQTPSGGPRQDYLDAFGEDDDLFTPRTSAPRPPATAHPADPYAAVTDWDSAPATGTPAGDDDDDAPPTGAPAQAKGGKGRAFTGIAAAAVTTVLAVVVAGQVTDERDGADVRAQSATDQARDVRDSASRGDDRETPGAPGAEMALSYEQRMDSRYRLSPDLTGSGEFEAVPGIAKGPGTGQKITYRVDVEKGLGLDAELFAEAVHRTLNDDRSWAHNGARTFERIHSGRPDFVITLASPGTTAEWCAKSGLDTTVDNVSCDSAATERVMINAYRWAQGAETYGDALHAYRQMLINHEIGHRLGYNHVTCDKDGDLAPVMQQQTKFLEYDGISCRPNPWAYPKS